MHNNTAMRFAFKCAEMKFLQYPQDQSFKMAANHFKRSITAIAVRKRNMVLFRVYFFKDGTSCIYNYSEQEFQFNSSTYKS